MSKRKNTIAYTTLQNFIEISVRFKILSKFLVQNYTFSKNKKKHT